MIRDFEESAVVVTGVGAISPFGIGAACLYHAWSEHRSALARQLWPAAPEIGPVVCAPLASFDVRTLVPGLRPPTPMRYSQMALAAVALAIGDGGLMPDSMDPFGLATIVATEFGAIQAIEDYMRPLILKGAVSASPLLFSRTVANVALGDVARWLGARGPSSLVLGENPIGEAVDLLQSAEAEAVVIAAVDELRLIVPAYASLGLLRTVGDDPGTSPDRLAIGEAAIAMLLETAEHARSAGRVPLAQVAGYATGGDPRANFTLIGRGPDSIRRTMKQALERARIEPSAVTAVMGAGTPGRVASGEDQALRAVFGDSLTIAVSRPKEIMGESFASAALVGLSLAALAVAGARTGRASRERPQPLFLCNSFALGGGATSTVICGVTK